MNIVITGTGGGLGFDLALKFLDEGHNVYGISRKHVYIYNGDYSENPAYYHYSLDISKQEMVKSAFESMPTIDILINNAAVFSSQTFQSLDCNLIHQVIDTNIKGTMFVTKEALNNMVSGRIFFINSVAGLELLDNQTLYCASKHAISAFADILAREIIDKDIHITSIYPGAINTPMQRQYREQTNQDIDEYIFQQMLQTDDIYSVIKHVIHSPKNTEYRMIKMYPTINIKHHH